MPKPLRTELPETELPQTELPQAERFDHIVVGGGVMGLAATWQLARRGRRVLLLERFDAGHTLGASHGSTRNMNNAYTEAHYLDLYDEALGLWRELEHASGEQLLTLNGLVTHGDPEQITATHQALRARNAATELITPEEATARWPGMRFEGSVLFNRDAGRVHAATALEVLAAEARRCGAEIRHRHCVTSITTAGDRVIVEAVLEGAAARDGSAAPEPSGSTHRADPEASHFEAAGVVVAAGAWSRELLSGHVQLPSLTVTEEHPAHFAPRPEFIEPGSEAWWPSFNHIRGIGSSSLNGPAEMAAPVDPRGGAVYGMLTPGEGVKVGFHLTGDEVSPATRRFRASDLMRQALHDYVASWFPGLDPASANEISCTYTSTPSGRFVLDRVGPVTFAAGFSGHGFKFAPAIGRILADAEMGVAFPPAAFRLSAH